MIERIHAAAHVVCRGLGVEEEELRWVYCRGRVIPSMSSISQLLVRGRVVVAHMHITSRRASGGACGRRGDR